MSVPSHAVFEDGVTQVTGDNLNTFVQSCTTTADARGFIGAAGMAMQLQGYSAAGDGGAGLFYWSTTNTYADDNGITTIVPSGAGSGAWRRLALNTDLPTIYDFGATGNGSTDDGPAFNAANTLALTLNGLRVLVPHGNYAISTPIVITAPFVAFETPAGGMFPHDAGTPPVGSQLRWLGASGGVMMTVQPAGIQTLTGIRIRGLKFDGNVGLAGKGLVINSCRSCSFDDLFFEEFSVSGLELGVLGTLSESSDCQSNTFDRIAGRFFTATGAVVRWKGNATANTSFNRFGVITLQHNNGPGLLSENSDNNLIETLRCFRAPGGTGFSFDFSAVAAGPQNTRENVILNYSANAAGIARGTDTLPAGASPTTNCLICYLDEGNATPFPTIGTGATLRVGTDDGTFSNLALWPLSVATSLADARLARSNSINEARGESLRVYNTADSHIVFDTLAGYKWSARVIGATGNFTITQLSGATASVNTPRIIIAGCPTSAAGLGSGAVWSNAGVLNIVP